MTKKCEGILCGLESKTKKFTLCIRLSQRIGEHKNFLCKFMRFWQIILVLFLHSYQKTVCVLRPLKTTEYTQAARNVKVTFLMRGIKL